MIFGKIFVIAAAILSLAQVAIAADVERYTLQFGTALEDGKNGVCINKANDFAYVVGFNNNNEFSITVISTTGINVMARSILTPGSEEGLDCVIDEDGNLVIGGVITGSGFETQTAPAGVAGSKTGLIAKFDGTTLATLFIQFVGNDLGATGSTMINSITHDAANNYYVAGTTNGGMDGSTVSSADNSFWGKFDSSGAKDYLKTHTHTDLTQGNCIALDATNNLIYVAGMAKGQLYDGEGFLAGSITGTHKRAVVTKIDATTGAVVSGHTFTDGSNDAAYGCAVDPSGNIYASGSRRNPGAAWVSSTQSDYTLRFYNDLGQGGNFDVARGIAVQSNGVTHVAGATRQTTFEGYAIPNAASTATSIFYAKLNIDGTTDYGRGYASDAVTNDVGTAIALDSVDNMVTGCIAGDNIGAGPHAGGTDHFVFSWGDPFATNSPTKAPSQPPTQAPTCQVIEIESAHPYPRDDLQSWNIDVPAWGGCYKVTMDPESWTPEKYDFVRLFSVTGGTPTQIPTADRLYKMRLPNYGTQQIYADSVDVMWFADYVNPSYLRRYPWTDKFTEAYGFKMYFTCCDV